MSVASAQTKSHRGLGNRIQAQLGMLVAMFLLGIAVNLIGLPSEVSGTAKAATSIFLILHGLLGIGLIVNAGLIVYLARKSNAALVKQTRIGAIVIVLTFIAGVITIATKNNWWSFAMSVGFAASLPIYGLLLLRARTN